MQALSKEADLVWSAKLNWTPKLDETELLLTRNLPLDWQSSSSFRLLSINSCNTSQVRTDNPSNLPDLAGVPTGTVRTSCHYDSNDNLQVTGTGMNAKDFMFNSRLSKSLGIIPDMLTDCVSCHLCKGLISLPIRICLRSIELDWYFIQVHWWRRVETQDKHSWWWWRINVKSPHILDDSTN